MINFSDLEKRKNSILNLIPDACLFLKQTQLKVDLDINKKGITDLVTEADIGVEKIIIECIQKNFKEDSILGEESGLIESNGKYKWIIDPVDGTTNYANKLPIYGVSIGLEDIESKEIVFGVVAVPELNDVYHALKGGGSFKNNKQIKVSVKNELINSLLCTGFPYEKENIDKLLNNLKSMILKSRGVRRFGAATVDLCWVAEGRFDGFWEEKLKPWDMAAPSIIVEEAGGKLSTIAGLPFSVYLPSIVASNGIIHEEMLNNLVP